MTSALMPVSDEPFTIRPYPLRRPCSLGIQLGEHVAREADHFHTRLSHAAEGILGDGQPSF